MNQVKIIQCGGTLFIGEVLPGPTSQMTLGNPRVVKIGAPDQRGQSQIFFLMLLGAPAEITLYSVLFSYPADCDPAIVQAYRENVTGLTLPRQAPIELVKG